jgi:hypothetical protein
MKLTVWNNVLPVLRQGASPNVKAWLQWPDYAVRHLLELAHAPDPTPFGHAFGNVWNILQNAIHSPVSGATGDKYWIADTRLVKLLAAGNFFDIHEPGPYQLHDFVRELEQRGEKREPRWPYCLNSHAGI